MSTETQTLALLRRQGLQDAQQLLPFVYEELRRLAMARMARERAGHTMQPTELVHEAWLRLTADGERYWNNRPHFFRAAAQAMRRILVDRARHKASIKAGGGGACLDPAVLNAAASAPDEHLILIDEALDRLEREDPESARIVMLKFFAGLTNREVARTLAVNIRTVERHWCYAKASLLQTIRELENPPSP